MIKRSRFGVQVRHRMAGEHSTISFEISHIEFSVILFSLVRVVQSYMCNLIQSWQTSYKHNEHTLHTLYWCMMVACHSCLQNRARALSSFPGPLTTLSKFWSLTPQLPLIRPELATYLYRRPQNHPVFYLIAYGKLDGGNTATMQQQPVMCELPSGSYPLVKSFSKS